MIRSTSTPKILVAIPAYNCEKQIPRVLQSFDKDLLEKINKIIVLNNRSTDNTVSAALEAAKKARSKKIMVVTNVKNVSLGGSHKIAFLYGKKNGFDYVAILHGDDQAEVKDLDLLIREILTHNEYGAVLGSRFMKGSVLKGYDWKRILGNKILNSIYSVFMFRKVSDLGSGNNIYKLSYLDDKEYINFGDDLGFNFDLLLYLLVKKIPVKFIPITWKEDDQVSNAHNFKIAKLAFCRLFKWRLGIAPSSSHKRKISVYSFKKEY